MCRAPRVRDPRQGTRAPLRRSMRQKRFHGGGAYRGTARKLNRTHPIIEVHNIFSQAYFLLEHLRCRS